MYKNEYSTSSLPLATAIQLICDDKLLLIDSSSKRANFIFEQTEELQEIVNKFWNKELSVDALSYFETLRYLKSRLYEGRGV